MRKVLAAAGATVLALGLGVAALAQPPGPDGRGGPGKGRGQGMARFLGLSDEQKAQVEKLMEGQRAQHQALWDQMKTNRQQLEQALESANPDPTTVGEMAIEGHRLRAQGRALRDAQDKAIRALLTPDQQAKFDAMKALRGEGMGPGFRHWGAPEAPRP